MQILVAIHNGRKPAVNPSPAPIVPTTGRSNTGMARVAAAVTTVVAAAPAVSNTVRVRPVIRPAATIVGALVGPTGICR